MTDTLRAGALSAPARTPQDAMTLLFNPSGQPLGPHSWRNMREDYNEVWIERGEVTTARKCALHDVRSRKLRRCHYCSPLIYYPIEEYQLQAGISHLLNGRCDSIINPDMIGLIPAGHVAVEIQKYCQDRGIKAYEVYACWLSGAWRAEILLPPSWTMLDLQTICDHIGEMWPRSDMSQLRGRGLIVHISGRCHANRRSNWRLRYPTPGKRYVDIWSKIDYCVTRINDRLLADMP